MTGSSSDELEEEEELLSESEDELLSESDEELLSEPEDELLSESEDEPLLSSLAGFLAAFFFSDALAAIRISYKKVKLDIYLHCSSVRC